MKTKILSMLMALTAAVVLASCAEKKPPVDTDVPEDNTVNTEITLPEGEMEKEDYLLALSNEKFDGYNYRILVRKGNTGSQYFEEPQEDIVDQAIYTRNKKVEEKYGITISISESSSNNYDTSALNSILAGDDAYDVVFAHSRAAFSYAIQGAAYNVHDIESIHPEMPWWSKNIVRDCTVGGNLYVLDGDISIHGLNLAMCLVFNKNIFDELGYDYPYETVLDGDWTFDEFAYYVKKGAKDLNGDGVIKYEEDRVGFATGAWSAPIAMPYTGGQKIYTVTDEGDIELSLYSAKTVEIFDEYFSLMKNDACSNTADLETFSEGRIMFYAGGLSDAKTLRNMDQEFGIVPYPKFDEDDEYASITNGAAPLMIIPITVPDVERTGAITEALCIYGSVEVIPAFYERALKTKYARDDDSEQMMDLVKDSIVFDLGYLAGGPFDSVGYHLANSTNPDFASFYAAREESAKVSLENFKRDYGGIEE